MSEELILFSGQVRLEVVMMIDKDNWGLSNSMSAKGWAYPYLTAPANRASGAHLRPWKLAFIRTYPRMVQKGIVAAAGGFPHGICGTCDNCVCMHARAFRPKGFAPS